MHVVFRVVRTTTRHLLLFATKLMNENVNLLRHYRLRDKPVNLFCCALCAFCGYPLKLLLAAKRYVGCGYAALGIQWLKTLVSKLRLRLRRRFAQ